MRHEHRKNINWAIGKLKEQLEDVKPNGASLKQQAEITETLEHLSFYVNRVLLGMK